MLGERMSLPIADGIHPCFWTVEELEKRCQLRTQSRSGPGGQHRNRTASGAFLTFDSGVAEIGAITAEATEQRQQGRNRSTALARMRYLLAVTLRSQSPLVPKLNDDDVVFSETELDLRDHYRGSPMKLNEDNVAKPGVLTLVLNDLWCAGGQPSLIAPHWKASTSKLVNLVRSHAPAFRLVNQIRQHHSRPPLR
ncbi:Class I peptide chain release factor [Rhodopirellula europaea 6C]|uniref:Class I peptide chain release factor n=2 Tax=Rhodopirellula TaxID=265488 RepID=M2AX61_9BACT|nr:Class I peptide chain release factor [Rhodopirellula europaea 6C]